MYIPGAAPFDLWQRDGARGLKLYVRRVFIMDDAEQFLPLYLRFVKGVLDSADLPLNVSRELLQADSEVEAMRAALTRRVLELLAKLAKDEPAKYQGFWSEFGAVLKEGLAEDHGNRDKLLPLLRFALHAQRGRCRRGLAGRLRGAHADRPGQDLLRGRRESRGGAQPSGHRGTAGAQRRGAVVRPAHRRLGHGPPAGVRRQEVQGRDARRPRARRARERRRQGKAEAQLKESKPLLKRVKDALGERVSEVRVSTRLKDSAAVLVAGEHDMSAPLRRALEAAGQKAPAGKPVLELNVEHHLVKYLEHREDAAEFGELALVIFEQAMLAEGAQLPDPGAFVQRLNRTVDAAAVGDCLQ